jgi:hypothetical protein
MQRYLQLQADLHKVKLDSDIKIEGSIKYEHSKHPKSESMTVNLAKSESVDHAKGQATGLAFNNSYTRHHDEDWLEVKEEMNEGWQAEMIKIDGNIAHGGLIINSTEISAESPKSLKNPNEVPRDLRMVFPSCFEEDDTIITRTATNWGEVVEGSFSTENS